MGSPCSSVSDESAQLTANSGPPRSACSTVPLTAGSDTPTANDRRNLLIAQRRADDVHSGSRRDLDEFSLVRKGQFPFNDALEEGAPPSRASRPASIASSAPDLLFRHGRVPGAGAALSKGRRIRHRQPKCRDGLLSAYAASPQAPSVCNFSMAKWIRAGIFAAAGS
jgi:hypothetical protein